MSRLELALRCGAAVEAVRELRRAPDSFDARVRQLQISEGKLQLSLPEGSAELRWLNEQVPGAASVLAPARGVYSLAFHEANPPLGTVRRLILQPGEPASDDFSNGCERGARAARAWIEKRLGPRGWRSCTFAESPIGVPAGSPDLAKVGRSAGLAAAIALACHELGEELVGVAATGEVDADGRVLPVGGLEAKLEAVVRETPFVTKVLVPAGRPCALPRGTRGRLAIIPVETVDEALSALFRASQVSQRNRSVLAEELFGQCIGPESGDAAHLRLTWEIAFAPCADALNGWRQAQREEHRTLFSQLDLGRLRPHAPNLAWRDDEAGPLPVAWRLDMSELGGAKLVLQGEAAAARVESVELLPILRDGQWRAFLGIRIAVARGPLREVLSVLSARTFPKVELEIRGGGQATFAGVIKEIEEALAQDRKPGFEGKVLDKNRQGMLPVLQHVVLPADVHWRDDDEWLERWTTDCPPSDQLGVLWSLLSTRSLPTRDYPKSTGPVPWKVGDAKETLHGIGYDAAMVLAREDAKQFNSTQKPTIVTEAFWVLFLLAHELRATRDEKRARGIEAACKARPRGAFFRRCCEFYGIP